jgi:hypothetical protein
MLLSFPVFQCKPGKFTGPFLQKLRLVNDPVIIYQFIQIFVVVVIDENGNMAGRNIQFLGNLRDLIRRV